MSSIGNVVSASIRDGSCTIKYDDGTESVYHSVRKEFSTEKSGGAYSSKSNSTYTSTSKHGGSSGGYHYGNSGGYSGGSSKSYSYGYSSGPSKMTPAFTIDGIEFFGGPKTSLSKVDYNEDGTDVILNCTGHEWTPDKPVLKRWIKVKPEFIPDSLINEVSVGGTTNGDKVSQVVIDWPDMKTPPESIDLDYWIQLYNVIKDNGFKRVYCCCTAGKGRTGTLLASMMLASGYNDEPVAAIKEVRDKYCSGAIETKEQERYVFYLVYEDAE